MGVASQVERLQTHNVRHLGTLRATSLRDERRHGRRKLRLGAGSESGDESPHSKKGADSKLFHTFYATTAAEPPDN